MLRHSKTPKWLRDRAQNPYGLVARDVRYSPRSSHFHAVDDASFENTVADLLAKMRCG